MEMKAKENDEDFQDEVNEESRVIERNLLQHVCTKQRFCISLIVIFLLIATIGGGKLFLANNEIMKPSSPSKTTNDDLDLDSESTNHSTDPSASGGESIVPLPEDNRRGMILSILRPYFRPSSPLQIEAINWISNVDTWTTTASSSSSSSSSIKDDNDDDEDVSNSMWLERYIAAILYFSTDGKSWEEDATNLWLSSGHTICDWKGIQCNGNVQVEEIDLFNKSLNGEIPSELGMLSTMTSLVLKNNQLFGTIPSELGILSQIKTIDISYNNLTGMIPSDIGKLFRLDSIELSHNSLTGTIPLEVENLARAGTHVYLGRNDDVQDCDPSILICP
mmetsp:Transcript_33076/g.38132  ORF Transcript_33076/g.38132 Transcript_33076/m.38132 type:complete len:334 (-) Transcript_33076:470-1471(-)